MTDPKLRYADFASLTWVLSQAIVASADPSRTSGGHGMPRRVLTAAITTISLASSTAMGGGPISGEFVYTFSFAGASGEFAGESFSGLDVSWSLAAYGDDVQGGGSAAYYHVRPFNGWVEVDDELAWMTRDRIRNSEVWAATNLGVDLWIGFGIDPTMNFNAGRYDGPTGWNMTSAFAASAIGGDRVLLLVRDLGIDTVDGVLRVDSFRSAAFRAIQVPAPSAIAVSAIGLISSACRRRRR